MNTLIAQVVELVDTQDLKSCVHCERIGSSPIPGTQKETNSLVCLFFLHYNFEVIQIVSFIILFLENIIIYSFIDDIITKGNEDVPFSVILFLLFLSHFGIINIRGYTFWNLEFFYVHRKHH